MQILQLKPLLLGGLVGLVVVGRGLLVVDISLSISFSTPKELGVEVLAPNTGVSMSSEAEKRHESCTETTVRNLPSGE